MKQLFQKHAPMGLVFILALVVVIETGLLIGGYIYYQNVELINENVTAVNKETSTSIPQKSNRTLLSEKMIEGDRITAYRLNDELSTDWRLGSGVGVFAIILDDGINKYTIFSVTNPVFHGPGPGLFEVIKNEIWVVNGQTNMIDVYKYTPEIRDGKKITSGLVKYINSIDLPEETGGQLISIRCEENNCIIGTASHLEAGCQMNLNITTKEFSNVLCSSLNEDLEKLNK